MKNNRSLPSKFRPSVAFALSLALAIATVACAQTDGGAGPENAAVTESALGTTGSEGSAAAADGQPEVENNGRSVTDSLVFAGQPTETELAEFARAGYRVLDLRTAEENRGFDQSNVADELDLEYQVVPVNREALADPEVHAAFREAIAGIDQGQGPLLVHCASGNRVAGLYYAHLVEREGMARDQALAKAQELGLTSEGVRAAVENYLDARAEVE